MTTTLSPDYFGRISAQLITTLEPNEVFVFGSNTAGQHWGGAARLAHAKFGAIWGAGIGLHGQSYAIPTLTGDGKKVSLTDLEDSVNDFVNFAASRPDLKFLVTEIGCGIAGFSIQEIAPLFANAVNQANIWLPERFWQLLRQASSGH